MSQRHPDPEVFVYSCSSHTHVLPLSLRQVVNHGWNSFFGASSSSHSTVHPWSLRQLARFSWSCIHTVGRTLRHIGQSLQEARRGSQDRGSLAGSWDHGGPPSVLSLARDVLGFPSPPLLFSYCPNSRGPCDTSAHALVRMLVKLFSNSIWLI